MSQENLEIVRRGYEVLAGGVNERAILTRVEEGAD